MFLIACAGCAIRGYEARPLEPQRSADSIAQRSVDEPGLRDYMIAHGHPSADWPVKVWGLPELTLLAFYFHADLTLARSQAALARAAPELAGSRAPLELTTRAEHHTDAVDGRPWSLGFELEIPFPGTSRRVAGMERQRQLADKAALHIGAVVWQIRAQVRDALFDVYEAAALSALAEREKIEAVQLTGLLERRLREGMASAGEVTASRLQAAEFGAEVDAQRAAGDKSLAALSRALGLPLDVTRALQLSFAALDSPAAVPDSAVLRSQALQNRIDIREELLAYAAAESAVRMEVASQYPQLRLVPGYFWDRGDSVWSLAVGWVLPGTTDVIPRIREAEARRALAAVEFERLQARVIADAESAAAVHRQTRETLEAVNAQDLLMQQGLARTQKLFDAGYADRTELIRGRLVAMNAQKKTWAVRRRAFEGMKQAEDAAQLPLMSGPLPNVGERQGSPAQ
ncbi:MAG: TolC family protein [Burkholderiales bacterium]